MYSDRNNPKTINALVTARPNISLVTQWAASLDHATFCADFMRCYAIQYAFIVMAEAIKDIPESILRNYESESYWRDIIDFRNHLAHSYDDKLDHRIMETIHTDLPALDTILEKILNDLDSVSS